MFCWLLRIAATIDSTEAAVHGTTDSTSRQGGHQYSRGRGDRHGGTWRPRRWGAGPPRESGEDRVTPQRHKREEVDAVSVEVASGAVVVLGGAWVSVTGQDLRVA